MSTTFAAATMSQPQLPMSMPIASITPPVPIIPPMQAPMPPRPPTQMMLPPPPLRMGPPPRVPLPPGPRGHMGPPPHLPQSGPNYMRPPHNQRMMAPQHGFNRPPNVPFHMVPPHGRFDRPPHPRPDFIQPPPTGHMMPPGRMPFPGHTRPLPRPPLGVPIRMGGPPPQYIPQSPTSLAQGHTNYPAPGFFTRPAAPPPEQFSNNRVKLPSGSASSGPVPPYQISNSEITSSVSGVDDEMELELPEEEAETDMSIEPVKATLEHQPSTELSNIVTETGSVPVNTGLVPDVKSEATDITAPDIVVPTSNSEETTQKERKSPDNTTGYEDRDHQVSANFGQPTESDSIISEGENEMAQIMDDDGEYLFKMVL